MKKRCIALLLAALLLPIAALATDGREQAMALLESATAASTPEKGIELLLQAGELAGDDVELLVSCAQLLFYIDEKEAYADVCEEWLLRALDKAEGTAKVSVLQVLTEQMIYDDRADEAIALVREVEAEMPDNDSLLITLATVLYYGDQGELAVTTLEELIEDSPRNAEAWRLRAAILLDLCRWDDALQAYRQIQEQWPDYLDGTYGEYLTYIASGQFDKGVRTMDMLLSYGADDSLWLDRARVRLWKQYKPEQALDEAEALLRKDPEWLDAATVRLASLLMLERYRDAETEAETIAEIDPNYGGMLHAIVRMNEARWTDAEDELLSLVEDMPTFTAAWKNLSAVRLDGYDDVDGAEEAIGAAFANSGTMGGDADMYLQLGEVYRAKGEWEEAGRAYMMANAVTWEDPQPLYRLIMLFLDAGRGENALEMLTEMERRYPGWYETMLARVIVENAFGNDREAMDAYRRFAAKFEFPASTMPMLEAIIRVSAEEMTDTELTEFLQVTGENESNPEIWDVYVYCLIRLGDLELAEGALARAESLMPEAEKDNGGKLRSLRVSMATTRAELYYMEDSFDEAVEALAEAMALGWSPYAMTLNPRYKLLWAHDAFKALLAEHPEMTEYWDLSVDPAIP